MLNIFIFLLFFLTIYGFERKTETSISVSNIEIVDQRDLVVPLGENAEFPCHIKEVGDFPNTDIFWRILYFDPISKENQEETLRGTSKHGRFQVDSSGVMYGFGLQSIHNGIIAECVQKIEINRYVPASSNTSLAVKYIASRLKVVIQDCSTNKDSVLYGSCSSVKASHSYEFLEVECHPLYTGQFCEVEAKDAFLWEMLNYAPIIVMLLVIVIIAFFYSMIVKCMRRKHKMRLAKFIVEPPPRDPAKLYRACNLTAEELQRLSYSMEHCKPDDDSGIGSGSRKKGAINLNEKDKDEGDSKKRKQSRQTCGNKSLQLQMDTFAKGAQRVNVQTDKDKNADNQDLEAIEKHQPKHNAASPDKINGKENLINKKDKSDKKQSKTGLPSISPDDDRPQNKNNNNNEVKKRSRELKNMDNMIVTGQEIGGIA